jgi:hypothetical protein
MPLEEEHTMTTTHVSKMFDTIADFGSEARKHFGGIEQGVDLHAAAEVGDAFDDLSAALKRMHAGQVRILIGQGLGEEEAEMTSAYTLSENVHGISHLLESAYSLDALGVDPDEPSADASGPSEGSDD